jgi:adenylosuccinate synthase
MVIAPDAFFAELERLHAAGVESEGRLFVSNRAHAVMPYAPLLDQAREAARGKDKIGTTSRGIGPTYEAKASRYGFRLGDLGTALFEQRLPRAVERVAAELKSLGGEESPSVEEVLTTCRQWAERLRPFLTDTEDLLHAWMEEGKNLLLEGAQGTFLDVDHGTYPFVTSSNSTAGGAAIGTGLPPNAITGAIGVLKAYTTRVGEGPFATEEQGDIEEHLRQRGNEFGTTTGRPRRCGWLDVVASRYSRRINGVEAIALTKLDVLDSLAEIPVCTGYRVGGAVVRDYTLALESGEGEPIYKTMKGWQRETVGILEWEDLPQEARDYIDFIEQEVGAAVSLISTGPRREETLVRRGPALDRLLGEGVEAVLQGR